MNKKRVILIINPCAGKRKGEKLKDSIKKWFDDRNVSCDIILTNQRMHAADIAAANAANYDIISCMGGDGTLNETMNGLIQSGQDKPLGYIPAGSTNDFARSMKLSLTPERAVDDIIASHTQDIDIGKFNERYFSYVASFGAFTKASYTTPQSRKNKLGHMAYLLEGSKELFNLTSARVSVTADGQHFEGDYLLGAISNSRSIAGIVKLKKSFVDFHDGMMELVLIKKPDNFFEFLEAVRCIRKQNYDRPCIQVAHARHFEIDCLDDLNWSLDGECYEGGKHFSIDCMQSRIKLISPQN